MGEQGYLDLINKVLTKGERRKTRNAEVLSLFGERLEFDNICIKFPLLTTKKVSLKNIFHELMFFIKGETNNQYLTDKGVNIWKGNTTKEFLESRELSYDEGDCGPIYGFQWNHWGAEYKGCKEDYNGKGINQIDQCINLIKNDPYSRRIVMSAWNVEDLDKMCLPPCHIIFQFYVHEKDGKPCYLDGQLYQRSADLMLGVPYNIASYALLLKIVAKRCNLIPDRLVLTFGDVHIYSEHIMGALEQIKRSSNPFPNLYLKDEKDIREYEYEDLVLSDYNPQKPIKMKMIA